MQFHYPQFLSCHEADGAPSGYKNGNSSNGQALDMGLELNSVLIFIAGKYSIKFMFSHKPLRKVRE